jgi:hypothetical protein
LAERPNQFTMQCSVVERWAVLAAVLALVEAGVSEKDPSISDFNFNIWRGQLLIDGDNKF